MENTPESRIRKKIRSFFSSVEEDTGADQGQVRRGTFKFKVNLHNEHWMRYMVLRDAVIPRMPVRMQFRMCAVSNVFIPSALASNTREEVWFLMNKYPGRRLQKISTVGEFRWDIVTFSDMENVFFRVPALNTCHRLYANLVSTLGQSVHGGGDGDDDSNTIFSRSGGYPGVYVPSMCSAGGLICACVQNPKFKAIGEYPDSKPLGNTHLDSDCTEGEQLTDFRVILFNCLSGSVKQLPVADSWDSFPWRDVQAMNCQMSMAKNGWDYYVLLSRYCNIQGKPRCQNVYQLYDSCKACWKFCQSPSLATPDSTELLSCDFFYLHCEKGPDFLPARIVVLGYLASADKWFKTTLTSQQDIRLFHHWSIREIGYCNGAFVKHNGRLLVLVTCLKPGGFSIEFPDTVVLEVVPISSHLSTVKEISKMPSHLSYPSKGLTLLPHAIGAGTVFCVTFFTSRSEPDDKHVVVYDVSKDHWYPIPVPNANDEDKEVLYTCFGVVNPRSAMVSPHVH